MSCFRSAISRCLQIMSSDVLPLLPFSVLLAWRGGRGRGLIARRMEARAVERDCYRENHRCNAQDRPIRHGRRSYRIVIMLTDFGVGGFASETNVSIHVLRLPRLHVMEVLVSGLLVVHYWIETMAGRGGPSSAPNGVMPGRGLPSFGAADPIDCQTCSVLGDDLGSSLFKSKSLVDVFGVDLGLSCVRFFFGCSCRRPYSTLSTQ